MIVIFSTRAPGPIRKGDQTILDAKIRFFERANKLLLICPKLDRIERLYFEQNYSSNCSLLEYERSASDVVKGLFRCLWFKMPFHYASFYSSEARIFLKRTSIAHSVHFMLARSLINYTGPFNQHSIDFVDSGYLALKKRHVKGFILKLMLYVDSIRSKKFECRVSGWFKFASAVSAKDADAIGRGVVVIPNGVRLAKVRKQVLTGSSKDRLKLVMTGNFDYPPNIEGAKNAIRYIAGSKFKDNVELSLVGISSDKFYQSHYSSSELTVRVSAIGEVEDIHLELSKHDVALAIINAGTGIQNKVLEAFSVGLPVVLTKIVAAGLPMQNTVGTKIVTNQEQFDQSVKFLMDSENRKLIAEYNRLHCYQNYNWEIQLNKLSDYI